jgi:hypothetical protein
VYQKALRELRDRYEARPIWGASLAQGIDAALASAAAKQPPLSDFAEARKRNQLAEGRRCAFVFGTANQANYRCVVLGDPLAPPSEPTGADVIVLQPAEAALLFRVFSAVHSATVKLKAPDVKVAIARLTLAQKRFDNLRKYGYLQYPWELAIDGALASTARYEACQTIEGHCEGDDAIDPEPVRAIFLHPGVGIAAPGFGDNGKPSADTAMALSLEVAGAVVYNESFDWYLGASAGAIVNDGDFRDPRLGLFVHVTRWVHAGYLMSFFREESRYDASIYLSMDLGTAFGASFIE